MWESNSRDQGSSIYRIQYHTLAGLTCHKTPQTCIVISFGWHFAVSRALCNVPGRHSQLPAPCTPLAGCCMMQQPEVPIQLMSPLCWQGHCDSTCNPVPIISSMAHEWPHPAQTHNHNRTIFCSPMLCRLTHVHLYLSNTQLQRCPHSSTTAAKHAQPHKPHRSQQRAF